MSRLEEVKAELKSILERDVGYMKAWTGAYDLASTLAAEVDARDEVITRLLEMLKNARKSIAYVDHVRGPVVDELHARALKIAGRTE